MRIIYMSNYVRRKVNIYLEDKELFFSTLKEKYNLEVDYDKNNIKKSYHILLLSLLKTLSVQELHNLQSDFTETSTTLLVRYMSSLKTTRQAYEKLFSNSHEPDKLISYLYLKDII